MPSRLVSLAVCCFLLCTLAPTVIAEDRSELVARVFARERATIDYLKSQRPVLETYFQTVREDGQPGHGDLYFLGEWDISPAAAAADGQRPASRLALIAGQRERSFGSTLGLTYTVRPAELTDMFFVDPAYFSPESYLLSYEKEEILQGIPCAVFLFQPIPANAPNRVLGRIWVELSSASIIRIHGKFTLDFNPLRGNPEFDSWRWRSASGFWLPYYLYSESTIANPAANLTLLRMRMTTYVWSYSRPILQATEQRQIAEVPVLYRRDDRANEDVREAKLVEWLADNGLIAPKGPVDAAVCNVARALVQVSGLPPRPISCRVLLTSPLESFTVGQTIVVSRGLLDLVPDEPTLAAVIAHEVAHILLGLSDPPPVDCSGNIFEQSELVAALKFHANPQHENEARALAAQLIVRSPYSGTLDRLWEFAAAIKERDHDLPKLFKARFGGDIAKGLVRLATTLPSQGNVRAGALSLGSRIEIDPEEGQVNFATSYHGILSRTFPLGVAAIVPTSTQAAASNRSR